MTSNPSLLVIAGLDPAIHCIDAASLDRRAKPGDDSWVVQSNGIVV